MLLFLVDFTLNLLKPFLPFIQFLEILLKIFFWKQCLFFILGLMQSAIPFLLVFNVEVLKICFLSLEELIGEVEGGACILDVSVGNIFGFVNV